MRFAAAFLLLGACTGTVGGDSDPDPSSPTAGTGGPRGNNGGNGTGGTGGTIVPPAACKSTLEPGASPLMKLSAVQYRNTVRDLLKASGVAMVVDDVAGALASVPPDVDPRFAGLDNGISADHVSTFFRIAQLTSDGITSKADRLAAAAGACAAQTPVPASCVDAFLTSFGRRAYRRPLTPDEAMPLKALNDGKTDGAEVFRSIVLRLMTSPKFLTHLEVDGAPVSGRDDLLQLSPYEVASRLSYTFWQTMPDDALLEAAAKGDLNNDAGFNTQLARVTADPRARESIWQFWSQWLRVEGQFAGFDTTRPAFKALVAGEDIGAAGKDHHADMVSEMRELTEWVAFTKKGSLTSLLTTEASVTKSPLIAKLYNVAPWNGQGEPPTLPAGTRAGILTRSAMLVIGEEQTNPFHRGAIIRKRILCDPLASPDPTLLPPNALDAPPQNAMMTTRERYEGKMIPECRGCHNMFNDIGYVLESYDSLGRHRTMEKVYDNKTGKLLAELPIDATGQPRVDLSDMAKVNGPIELTKKVVESKKFEPCFSRSFFAYALRREVNDTSADQCAVDDMVTEVSKPGVALGDVYKRIALQPSFRRRKVGQ